MNFPNVLAMEKINCGRVEGMKGSVCGALLLRDAEETEVEQRPFHSSGRPESLSSSTRPAAHQSSGCLHSAAYWTELLPARLPQTVALLELRFCECGQRSHRDSALEQQSWNLKSNRITRASHGDGEEKSPSGAQPLICMKRGEDLLIEVHEDTQV